MKTYIKFLSKIFLNSFLYVTLIIFSLVFILNLLSEIDFFKDLDVNNFFPIYLSILNSPTLIFEMFPFIFLISTQLFFISLFNNDELNIFKYTGLKNTKILIILSTISFVLGLLIISLFYNFSSNLKNFYLDIKSNYTSDGKYLAVITKNGLWIKDIIDDKTLLINASKIEQNFLKDAHISEFDQNFQIIKNIISPKIDVKNTEWVVYEAEVLIENNKENFEIYNYKTNFDYHIIKNLFSNLSSLSVIELVNMRENYISLNYSLTDLNMHLLNLFSYPFYLILMTLISGIIMLNTKNFTNKYSKILLGLFVSVTIYYIFNYFYVLGMSEKINLILSISSPLIILLFTNVYFLRNINAK